MASLLSQEITYRQSTKSSQLEKKVEGFCLIIAPVLFAASSFFWEDGEYGVLAATLIIFSMFFWIPALMALFSLVKNEMPRYATWGLWIAVFGCVSGVCFAFLGYLTSILNISHQQYLDSLAKYPVSSQLLLFGSGPLFPLSILVLGIMFIVKRPVSPLVGCLFCIGAAGFPVGRITRIESIAHLADICLVLPCVLVAVQVFRNVDALKKA